MENKEIGRFYAKTFNSKYYEFVVKEDEYIYWNLLKDKKIKSIIIKPKFELFMGDGSHLVLDSKTEEDLIEVYSINPDLLQYLLKKNMIMYNNYERNCCENKHSKRIFKRGKNKEKILSK